MASSSQTASLPEGMFLWVFRILHAILNDKEGLDIYSESIFDVSFKLWAD